MQIELICLRRRLMAWAAQWLAAWMFACVGSLCALAQGTDSNNKAHEPPVASQPTPAQASRFSPHKLDTLAGPVAMYPDEVVGLVFSAAGHRADIVKAVRYLDSNAIPARTTAIPDTARTWNPAVVALLRYPFLLRMMYSNLSWTEELDRAVKLQQSDLYNAIDRVRQQMQRASIAVPAQNRESPYRTMQDRNQFIDLNRPAVVYYPAYPTVNYYYAYYWRLPRIGLNRHGYSGPRSYARPRTGWPQGGPVYGPPIMSGVGSGAASPSWRRGTADDYSLSPSAVSGGTLRYGVGGGGILSPGVAGGGTFGQKTTDK